MVACLAFALTAGMALAQSQKPGFEVIDLESPKHADLPTVSSPTAADEPTVTEDDESRVEVEPARTPAKVSERTAEKLSAIEAKKERRLEGIRAFFGKMKDEVDGYAPKPRQPRASSYDDEETAPRASARGRRAFDDRSDSSASEAGSSTSGGRQYKVQRGDTLAKIAKRFYGTTRKYVLIADANDLAPTDRIRVGQELTIPGDEDEAAVARKAPRSSSRSAARESKPAPRKEPAPAPDRAAKPAPAAPRPDGGKLDYASYEFKLYQVQAGDTFAGIAERFYQGQGDPSLIKLYNNQKGEPKPGDKLLIPFPKKGN
jgi:nucleoid-associated protein YgaU